jgi:hypothetical protein
VTRVVVTGGSFDVSATIVSRFHAADVASMVRRIEGEPAEAMIPVWPWLPLSYLIKYAPLGFVRRFS